jgi:hypothetical protein
MKPSLVLVWLLVCLLSAGLANALRAESVDDQLNTAYSAILNAPNANPQQIEELKHVEGAWLGFRSYWANLEATAGRVSPDGNIRQAATERITRQRTEQLRHIAKDGAAVDFPAQPLEMEAIKYFNRLQSIFINKKWEPNLDTFRWLQFAESQAKYDARWQAPAPAPGDTKEFDERMAKLQTVYDHLFLGHLKALAASAGLNAEDLTGGEGPTGQNTVATLPSAKGGFRLVVFRTSANVAKAWVVPANGGAHTELPLENSSGYDREFHVSPDGQWIVCTGKVAVGTGGIWLFHRAAPADFRFEVVADFEAKVWKYFVETSGVKAEGGTISFTAWRPDAMRFVLGSTVHHNAAERDVTGWQAEYDLDKKTFSVPKEFEKANRQALVPRGGR